MKLKDPRNMTGQYSTPCSVYWKLVFSHTAFHNSLLLLDKTKRLSVNYNWEKNLYRRSSWPVFQKKHSTWERTWRKARATKNVIRTRLEPGKTELGYRKLAVNYISQSPKTLCVQGNIVLALALVLKWGQFDTNASKDKWQTTLYYNTFILCNTMNNLLLRKMSQSGNIAI